MMTEIKYGAVLMAAALRHGIRLDHDDASMVLKYMGIEDQHLMVSNDLSLTTLRRYTGNGKFNDTLCSIVDVAWAAVEVCENLLGYTLKNKGDEDSFPAMLEFDADQKKLRRIATRIELAVAT